MSFERMRARAERVKTECDLGQLLQDYGYGVMPDRHREQQFQCDLHGVDNSPSARLYGHNNTTYCWACGKTRDPISYVVEKELINFRDAIEFLEKKLNLPPLPWSDEHERPVTGEDEIEAIVKAGKALSFEAEKTKIREFLQTETEDRLLSKEGGLDSNSILAFWEVFDRVDYGVARENWPEAKGAAGMLALRGRVMKKIKDLA